MAYTHTVYPGYIPLGYFDKDNVEFIKNKVTEVLQKEYIQPVNVDHASIIRIMGRVLEERLESVPKMNQRVVMYITNDFRNHQIDLIKRLNWEEGFKSSQKLYDPISQAGIDTKFIKLSNRLGKSRMGGTARFVFI